MTKSHISTVNAPARIKVPEEQKANESKTCLKHGRPIGSKDVAPRKRRTKAKQNAPVGEHDEQRTLVEVHIEQKTPEYVKNKQISPEEAKVPENFEISINYVHNREKFDRNKVIINNIFAFQMALDIIRNDENPEPQNVEECRNRNDWPKWKEAM